ncbi:MAG: PfkB family carbohydrate kinase [Elusimicrobiota bacterium]
MKKDFNGIIDSFKGKKVLVIGDLVLDEYWHGITGRVSREAPVLILDYEGKTCTLGGAANAINNAASLGANVIPISVLGSDPAADTIIDMFKSSGINCDGIINDKDVITPTKVRVMAGCMHTARQQVLRIDKQFKDDFSENLKKRIIETINKYSKWADVIIVSDYGIGVISPVVVEAINELGGKGIPVIVDSRYSLNSFRNILIATPNEDEAGDALQKNINNNNAEESARSLAAALKSKAMLITMGREGMALFDGKDYHKLPIVGSSDIVDVTGAGDTVVAVISLAYTAGVPWLDAAKLANAAASIVVMHRGSAVVSPMELKKIMA